MIDLSCIIYTFLSLRQDSCLCLIVCLRRGLSSAAIHLPEQSCPGYAVPNRIWCGLQSTLTKHVGIAVLFFCTLYSIQAQGNQDIPRQVLLTWQGNTSETMTITWRTDQAIDNPTLRYTHKPKRDISKWNQVNASSFTFEPSKAQMHTVELKGLKAGRDYHVVIDHPTQPDKFYFTTDINGKKAVKTVRF